MPKTRLLTGEHLGIIGESVAVVGPLRCVTIDWPALAEFRDAEPGQDLLLTAIDVVPFVLHRLLGRDVVHLYGFYRQRMRLFVREFSPLVLGQVVLAIQAAQLDQVSTTLRRNNLAWPVFKSSVKVVNPVSRTLSRQRMMVVVLDPTQHSWLG